MFLISPLQKVLQPLHKMHHHKYYGFCKWGAPLSRCCHLKEDCTTSKYLKLTMLHIC